VFDRGTDLVVRTDHGDVATRVLVNATGTWGAPFVPYYPGMRDFQGTQVHTATYRSAEELAGKRVLVVGGGTSAIGFLLELEGVAAKTFWATRRPVDYRDHGELDLASAVNAVQQQDAAARAGKALPSIVSGTGVPKTRRIAAAIERGLLEQRPMFDHLEPYAVVWPDGTRERIDAIIWATGFRPDLRHLAPLKLRDAAGGVAVTTGAVERDPRIFFAGYGPTASTIGANRAGRTLARQVFSALGLSTSPVPVQAPTTEVLPVVGGPQEPSQDRPEEPADHVAELMARFFTDA
jgi:putative flavoprotein involved in K+ transport